MFLNWVFTVPSSQSSPSITWPVLVSSLVRALAHGPLIHGPCKSLALLPSAGVYLCSSRMGVGKGQRLRGCCSAEGTLPQPSENVQSDGRDGLLASATLSSEGRLAKLTRWGDT